MTTEPLPVEEISPTSDEKNIATITHLAGTVFSIIPALIVWILKKDDNPYIAAQAKEALNFQITVLIAQLIAGALVLILIGFLLMGIIWLLNIVFCIIAAISTSKGNAYRYPMTIRLLN